MQDWIKSNGFSLVIAIAGVIATYSVNVALYGYRLQTIEDRMDRQGQSIQSLQAGDTATKVSLAKIQTDIEYIKMQLQKIVP